MSSNGSKSTKVRARLNHPVTDTDGHTGRAHQRIVPAL